MLGAKFLAFPFTFAWFFLEILRNRLNFELLGFTLNLEIFWPVSEKSPLEVLKCQGRIFLPHIFEK